MDDFHICVIHFFVSNKVSQILLSNLIIYDLSNLSDIFYYACKLVFELSLEEFPVKTCYM